MLSCKEVARLVASEEPVDTGWLTRASVRLHQLRCRHCRGYAAQLRSIGTAARYRWDTRPADIPALERLEHSILKRCLYAADVNTEDAHSDDLQPPATQQADPH